MFEALYWYLRSSLKQGPKSKRIFLNRVSYFRYFSLKQGQGFTVSVAHLHSITYSTPPPPQWLASVIWHCNSWKNKLCKDLSLVFVHDASERDCNTTEHKTLHFTVPADLTQAQARACTLHENLTLDFPALSGLPCSGLSWAIHNPLVFWLKFFAFSPIGWRSTSHMFTSIHATHPASSSPWTWASWGKGGGSVFIWHSLVLKPAESQDLWLQ